jgi:tetratricopeptide (TPR) repeat protein
VPPDADPAAYDAITLFLHGGQRVEPHFQLVQEAVPHVARVCRLVEGMPLGIELAAAWVDVLPPEEIAAETQHSLDFLAADYRDIPARHRSVRAAFDVSWARLSQAGRDVFPQLSVFRGGFTRQAAREVAATEDGSPASLRTLAALAEKSLLQYEQARDRYQIHELLRQYAAEKLDQSPTADEAVRDRHCAYYTAALQQWAENLKGPRRGATLAEMDVEIENARAAWNWAAGRGQVERLAQAMDGLCDFYRHRGRYQEGEVACRMAAERLAATTSSAGLRVLAKALAWQASFNIDLDQRESAGHLLRRSLAVLERPELGGQDMRPEEAFVLQLMGNVVIYTDPGEAQRPFEQSLVLYQALGDQWGAARVQMHSGIVAWALGASDEATRLFQESLSVRRALGDQNGMAESIDWLGRIAIHRMEFEEAERLHRESLAISQEGDDRAGVAHGLGALGVTLVRNGKFTEGQSLLEEGVRMYNDLGLRSGWAFYNVFLAHAKMHVGQYEPARALAHMSLSCSRELNTRHDIALSLMVPGWLALAEKAYVEAREWFQESFTIWQEVGNRPVLVWPLIALGYAARGLGDIPQARQRLSEALRAIAEIGTFLPLQYALPLAALLLADRSDKEQAVELYGLASRYPGVANSCWFDDVAGSHIAAVAAALPPDVTAAAQERGRARDLEATVAELLAELE